MVSKSSIINAIKAIFPDSKFDTDGNFYVNPGMVVPSAIGTGRKTVTSPGTAEKLVATATPCVAVTITALRGNTGVIQVGDASVKAAAGTQQGTPLQYLDSITLEIDDVSKIYIDATVANEGVAFTYLS
jgi:hypothetical protein